MINRVKYLIALILVLVFVTVVCACGNDDNIISDEYIGKNLSQEITGKDVNNASVKNSVENVQDKAASEVLNETDVSVNEKNADSFEKSLDTQGASDEIVTPNVEIDVTDETTDEIINSSENDEITSDSNSDAISNISVSANVEVIDGITYIDGILIVNKTYPLPESYAPQYDQEVLNSLTRMFSAASAEGHTLKVKSGYRSYIDQKIIYNNYVAKDGKALADTYSARPGHSEHQSALAFDLNQLLKSFGDTPEGIWLAQNCHKYGFIIRYPKGKEHITGYMYEPWHVRYLGVELATKVYESGLCLEEYLGITSVYSEN